ncbi:MAG: energy transducer TonB [Syntrophales bacterium]
MEGQARTLSLYFKGEENHENAGRFNLQASHAGIAISLAIHAVFLLFLALQPAEKVVSVKTFHISFDEESSSLLQKNPAASLSARKKETVFRAPANRSGVQGKSAVPAPAAAKKIAPEQLSPVSEKTPPVKSAEAIAPPVAQPARAGEFIAAAESRSESGRETLPNVLQPSGVSAGTAAFGRAGKNPGEIPATGSSIASGSNAGGHTPDGTDGSAPLETSFGETNAPTFLHREIPVYPSFARRQGKEGRVVLTLLIDQTGKVKKIVITEPAGYGLTEAAIEAVRKSTFAPASVNGRKVVSRAVLPVRFKLE